MQLEPALRANEVLWECLRRLASLRLPDWYLGAGCVAQTVWNLAHGKPAADDIVDYDVVYFEASETEGAEAATRGRVRDLLADLRVRLDVKNQARVHLWYERRFGHAIVPYASTADAIATWPTTATAIGLRLAGRDLAVCAPFGTDDLFALVVRANRVQVTREVYEAKAARWMERWPALGVVPWERGVGIEGVRRASAVR